MNILAALQNTYPQWEWVRESIYNAGSGSNHYKAVIDAEAALCLKLSQLRDGFYDSWLVIGDYHDHNILGSAYDSANSKEAIVNALIDAAKRALLNNQMEQARYYLRIIRHG